MTRLAIRLGGVILLMLLLACAGVILPLEICAYVLFGWVMYLRHVGGQVTVDWTTVVMTLAAICVFAAGMHGLMSWLARQTASNASDSVGRPFGRNLSQSSNWRWSWTLATVGIVLLMFIAGTAMVGVTHQTYWLATSPEPLLAENTVIEAASRNTSKMNLKQTSLATLTLVDEQEVLPSPMSGEFGELIHGWQALILPYSESNEIYDDIDWASSWDDPQNEAAYKTNVEAYVNPWMERTSQSTEDASGYPLSDYTANANVLGGTQSLLLQDSAVEQASTILFGEVVHNRKAWGYPANWRDPELGINQSPYGFGGPWKAAGANFSMLDGSVRFITEDVDQGVLAALADPYAAASE